MPPPPPNPPLLYSAHPSLALDYTSVPVSTWLDRHNKNICVGTGVLHVPTDTSPSRILLVQRASSEAFPFRWEIPGGGAETHEPDLLAVAARELYEETGLRATAFTAVMGSYSWVDRDPATGEVIIGKHGQEGWLKVSFVAEVDGARESDAPPEITLDPEEHRAFVWATEGEVRAGRVGDVDLDWTSQEQKADVLGAFGLASGRKGGKDGTGGGLS